LNPICYAKDGIMNDENNQSRRKNLRLENYDYSLTGAYFLTICTEHMKCLFGDIANGAMELNELGSAVERAWLSIPEHFPRAELDEYVVMPNHLHGIVSLMPETGAVIPKEFFSSPRWTDSSPDSKRKSFKRGPKPGSIPAIVGAFKATASRRINELRGTPNRPVWQRNYYEHIIRSERSLLRIREYVANNPLRWTLDRLNPTAWGDPDPT